jgi:hypothetical protein
MPGIEKNRYLELNLEPVGVPAWKRLVTSWAFVASMGGAVAVSNGVIGKTENGPAIPLQLALLSSSFGLATRSMLKFSMKFALTDAIGREYVIDTKPTGFQGGASIGKKIAFGLLTTSFGSGVPIGSFIMTFRDKPAPIDVVESVTVTFGAPLLVTAAESLNAVYKVSTGQWKIIQRGEMEQAKETAKEKSPTALPQLSA